MDSVTSDSPTLVKSTGEIHTKHTPVCIQILVVKRYNLNAKTNEQFI